MIDKIAETLNTRPTEMEKAQKQRSLVPSDEESFDLVVLENRVKDYTKIRDNLINIIDETELVVEAAADEVKTNPSARMFETYAALIKTYADINKDLLEISGGIKSASKPKEQPGNGNVNNLVFVGSSDSLIDTIRSAIK